MSDIMINQTGGTVIITPYEQEKKKRWWKRSFRLLNGRFYITLSNCRVKKRPTSCDHECSQKLTDNMRDIKGYRYKQQKGLCPECGQPFDIKEMELHHVLPWGRFPELRARKANPLLPTIPIFTLFGATLSLSQINTSPVRGLIKKLPSFIS